MTFEKQGAIMQTTVTRKPVVLLQRGATEGCWDVGLLRNRGDKRKAGDILYNWGVLSPFEGTLTDEEEALAFRLMLIGA